MSTYTILIIYYIIYTICYILLGQGSGPIVILRARFTVAHCMAKSHLAVFADVYLCLVVCDHGARLSRRRQRQGHSLFALDVGRVETSDQC